MPSDDVPTLAPNQIKVLKVLLSEGGELDNNELKNRLGVSLTGASRAKLEALGLVVTDRSRRIHSHKLTSEGQAVARRLNASGPPHPPKPAAPQYDPDLPRLSPNQVLVLVVLMSEARELSNNELKALGGLALSGADNTMLQKELGLVETDRSHTPYSHQLTDKGWAQVRKLHTMEPPKESKSAIRTLLTLLGNINRSLAQLQTTHGVKLSYGEFFRQQQAPADAGEADEVNAESMVRKAYALLAGQPGDWVGLADLRDQLPGLARTDVDAALMVLLDQEGVRIIPVANTKALTARDRAAAIDIGGEANHALSIGRP
jgi:DNA-binding MarR family transcriptional regulator